MPGLPNSMRLGQTLINSTLGAAMLGAGTAGAAAIIQRISKAYHDSKINERFNRMLMVSPELAQDPRARLAFNTFNRLNPQLADDPLVSSTFVRQVLATDLGGGPAVDPTTAAKLMGNAKTTPVLAAEAVSGGLSRGLARSISDGSELIALKNPAQPYAGAGVPQAPAVGTHG